MTMQTPEIPKPEAKKMRVFVADNREFPDPDPNLSIEEVKKLLADFLPELHNAEVKESDKGDKHYVQFIKKVGTKGAQGYRNWWDLAPNERQCFAYKVAREKVAGWEELKEAARQFGFEPDEAMPTVTDSKSLAENLKKWSVSLTLSVCAACRGRS